MTCSVAWSRRDEDGKRIQIEFKLVRDNISWKVKQQRFEPRETFQPDQEDWDALFEQLKRNFRRGTIQQKDIQFIKRYALDHGYEVNL